MERWLGLPPLNEEESDSVLRNPLKGRIVLIVEDDEGLLKTYAAVFLQQGAHVLKATDPDQALRMMRTVSPGLIVTDIDFAGTRTGLDLLASVGEAEELRNIPTIVISGREDQSSRTQALLLGARDFVRKPCTPTILVQRLRAVL